MGKTFNKGDIPSAGDFNGFVQGSDLSATAGAASVGSDDGASGSLWTTVGGFIAKIISSAGASVVGFIQVGTGAVARYVQTKLRESVSFEDFGAVGDGVTDDTTALTNAIASGQRVVSQRNKTYNFSSTLTITDKRVDFSGSTLLYTGAKNVFAMVVNAATGINGVCDVRNFMLKSTDTDTTNRTHGLCLGGSCGSIENFRIQGFTGISLAMGQGAESYTGVTLPATSKCYYWNVANANFSPTSGWAFVIQASNNANHIRNLSTFPFNGFGDSIPHAANCIDQLVIGGGSNTFERVSLEASQSDRAILWLANATNNAVLGQLYNELNANWAAPPTTRFEAQAGSASNTARIRSTSTSTSSTILDSGDVNDIQFTPTQNASGGQLSFPRGGFNMVKNGRFENGSKYWSDFSSGSVMSFGTGYVSGKSMRLDVTAGRPNVAQDLVAVGGIALAALKAGNVTVCGWARTNLADARIAFNGVTQRNLSSDGNWQFFISTTRLASAASSASVQIITSSSGVTGYVEVSDVTAIFGYDGLGYGPRDPLFGSATYNPPSLATNTETTTTVTVTGAVLGDFAEASFSLDTQGIKLNARVSAADTVTVIFRNDTGGTLDLASGTLNARVTKQ